MTLALYQCTGRHYCAGILVDHRGVVRMSAPILAWTRGRPLAEVERRIVAQGGSVQRLSVDTGGEAPETRFEQLVRTLAP